MEEAIKKMEAIETQVTGIVEAYFDLGLLEKVGGKKEYEEQLRFCKFLRGELTKYLATHVK